MPKQAPLPKIRYFHQQIIAERDTEADEGAMWRTVKETEPITDQVNAWVDQTGCVIISTSAPGYELSWADPEMQVKSIVIGVMVLYKPVENVHERPRKQKSRATATTRVPKLSASGKRGLFS